MARTSRLSNPEFAQSVAEAYANGMSRPEMADLFGAHVDTITNWTQDPRVQAHVGRVMQERVARISRKVDTEIERRIEDIDDEDKYPMELVLKLRKELLERSIRPDNSKGAEQVETINEVIANFEENPDLAADLRSWAQGKKKT